MNLLLFSNIFKVLECTDLVAYEIGIEILLVNALLAWIISRLFQLVQVYILELQKIKKEH